MTENDNPSSIFAVADLYEGLRPLYNTEFIGDFSVDDEGKFQLGYSQARYLCEDTVGKKLNLDLMDGFEPYFAKKPFESENWTSLDRVFQYLMSSSAKGTTLLKATSGCELVCRRGPLLRIASAPYTYSRPYVSNDVEQTMACTKYKGVIFLREFESVLHQRHQFTLSKNSDCFLTKFSFADRKFKHAVTSSEPDKPPNPKEEIEPLSNWSGVFKACLRFHNTPPKYMHRILYTAELDAYSEQKGEIVDLKTQWNYVGYGKSFSSKALRWCLQSLFIGSMHIVVGIQNDFHLKHVDFYPVKDLIPTMRGKGQWDLNVCFGFLEAFFHEIKMRLRQLPEGSILVVKRPAGHCRFNFSVVSNDDVDGQSKWAVLTEEFKSYNWT